MARKVEEVSGSRCSVCGQPATEDWQKYMAPRCAAHPHTATGRMVAGEAEPPRNYKKEELCVDEGCPQHGTPHVCINLEEELRDILSEGVAGTFHCTRVWAAWGVGTMSQEDFEPVDESDTPAELARAVMTKVRPLVEQVEKLHTALELARNGLAWYRDAYPDADSGADDEMMETIAVALGEAHDLYTDADKDRPDVICDSNGQVVLGLCKRCGKGEAELTNEDGTPSPCSRG